MEEYKYVVKVPDNKKQKSSEFYIELYSMEKDSKKGDKPVKVIQSMEELIDLFEKDIR